jgi:RimJ/RimL family protein N-acetyltransferase
MLAPHNFEPAASPSARLGSYPTTLIDVWRGRDGERLLLRPVLPQDANLLDELIRRSSPTSRYNRFHGAVNELPLEVLREMTTVDYRQHMALVITWTRADSEVVIADARYSVDPTGRGAEFAVLVEDRWQRSGLGRRAIHALVAAARRAGIARLHGTVLRGNVAMLSLLRHCGFRAAAGAEDARTVLWEKWLDEEMPLERHIAPSTSAEHGVDLVGPWVQ